MRLIRMAVMAVALMLLSSCMARYAPFSYSFFSNNYNGKEMHKQKNGGKNYERD